MKLSTKIITNNTHQIQRELSHFDHPSSLINQSTSSSPPLSYLQQHDITSYILSPQPNTKCFIVYKLQLDVLRLKQEMEVSGKKARLYEYSPTNKRLQLRVQFPGERQYEVHGREQNTLILQVEGSQNVVRVYLLPHSNGEEEAIEINRAIHQNFKFLRAINQYLRLQGNCQSMQLSDPIIFNITSFLYTNRIKDIQIILSTQQDKFDMKLLQKIGQLKLPQPWLEKQTYRNKKHEIFKLKVEENRITNIFKDQKRQFTTNINFLQEISGNTPENYENIGLHSLKLIKEEKLSTKLAEIKDHEKMLQNLEGKLKDLTLKKSTYIQKMALIQKDQISQISGLKGEILELQTQSTTNKNNMKSGLIFLKSRKSTQNHVLKTIFSSNDKKVERIRNGLTTDNLSVFEQVKKSSDRKKGAEASSLSKKQFKNNHKKVANVVREIESFKVNKGSLRQKYEEQMMRVEFEVEIRNNQLLGRYKDGCEWLAKLLQQNQDLKI